MPAPRRYDTGPLGRFAPGPWQRVEVAVRSDTQAVLTLDPNRIAWNGVSPTWASTRMAPSRFEARLRPLPARARPGQPLPAYPFRLYEILGVAPLAELGLGPRLRLALTDHPERPSRLLRVDSAGRVLALHPLRRTDTGAQPPVGEAEDLIALRTLFLGGGLGRTAFLQISGNLSEGTLRWTADTNAVQLDPVGEPLLSTLMAPLPATVRAVERAGLPPGTRARVFDLPGAPLKAALVIPRSMGAAPRLILHDPAGRPDAFLTLEPDHGAIAPLVGPTWRLVKIAYNDDRTLTPGSSPCTLRFSPDGQVSGQAGLNRYRGVCRAVDHQIRVGPLAATRAASPPGGIDGPFLRDLADIRSFRTEGDELWLMLPADAGTIVLRRGT